jgi:photosystem II stability/assembly factor-like uncharacterized protein
MIGGAIDGFVYFSTNSGSAWTQANLRNVIWGGVAVSADGTTFVAAANVFFDPLEDGGPIYISTNSGAGWFQSDAPIAHWQGIAALADGSRFVITDTEGEIYTSPDCGATWIKNAAPSLGWSSGHIIEGRNQISRCCKRRRNLYPHVRHRTFFR